MSDRSASPRPDSRVVMRELRIHGRGGQGAVIASKILASALFREGSSVQSFPAFGVERRGAPVTAFLRYSQGPILLRCEITSPHDLIILDPTLIKAIDVTQGLLPGIRKDTLGNYFRLRRQSHGMHHKRALRMNIKTGV